VASMMCFLGVCLLAHWSEITPQSAQPVARRCRFLRESWPESGLGGLPLSGLQPLELHEQTATSSLPLVPTRAELRRAYSVCPSRKCHLVIASIAWLN
jgi:hypothetical protein